MVRDYDIVVIGAGHAGCEAALAASRMGMSTCIFTMNLDSIAQMSCNPAIGGLAKGHLVREIDALGGEMARVADSAGIQFRVLNRSKGPAVWSLRAQADRVLYRINMRKVLEKQKNLDIKQASVEKLVVDDGGIQGVMTSLGILYKCRKVIIATGTFLKGLIHIGLDSYSAGRAGEFASVGLADSLRELGFRLGRLKTGTPPRIDARSVDFSGTVPQYGDKPPEPFSYSTTEIANPQLPCFITYTNKKTHDIILNNLDRSPLYSGRIKGIGPRYCPSIEDKVVRFAHRDRHQIFLEPEGLDTVEYYANGISTSLPVSVQLEVVRSIKGLENAEIMRPGYAIEYDFVIPTQLNHALETKKIEGLYLAGQINGTSGYEEAAAQGLMSGINAALSIKCADPLVLQRNEAYIGVLIDDLVTRGTNEPYRMFTSRAEFRLLLRHDNADMRLMDKGHEIGLLDDDVYERFILRRNAIENEKSRIMGERIKPDKINPYLREINTSEISEAETLSQLLRRPELTYEFIGRFSPPDIRLSGDEMKAVEVEVKYEGYIRRQLDMVEKMRRLEKRAIPPGFDFAAINGLSKEVLSKLKDIRPANIGQASRVAGVTPAAVSLIMVALEKKRRFNAKKKSAC
ncbi:tRNA uridine 5-carboxymethylaminomethyl modification enzyme MnmG [bacterium BMS3Abin07]|nr:tRNA uridine 5-carboxymethylaminomethyl modification enzyme MnmG [bacterium BMS3Abin07]GBE32758.1 tRNA uridine 5-carboxymethylaminomethyl modification enzyme MnmG [bacterium BMS3Bbin05]HDO22391.1 tRNA uridine-5-carboxymethylaminomethyl(34) synthesis enzyme MnmG [Nitrospirota bacterium]HDZ88007.1 tRNA uridine-5-carboxymethylaminomethyl(34) synthesis enzyme MnmG [Nitrospirota bacterium]